MQAKTVKARTPHTCEGGCAINPGELYRRLKLRVPVFDDNDKQISVQYLTFNSCTKCDYPEPESQPCDHEYREQVNTIWSNNGVPFPDYTGLYLCVKCGAEKK